MAALVPISIGRLTIDTDSRVARIIYWLLHNQQEITRRESVELIVSCGKQSVKFKVSTWHDEKDGLA